MTAEKLRRDGFGATPRFHCLIGELGGERVAYAIYFFVYSTWEGLSLYLEDLYVTERARGHGVGLAMMKALGRQMLANDCARFQWCVLTLHFCLSMNDAAALLWLCGLTRVRVFGWVKKASPGLE